LSHSIGRFWFDFPYNAPVPQLIGGYLRMEDCWANAGFFADAYANFGAAGVIGFSLALGLVLRVLDGLADALPAAVACALVAMPAFSLTNSGLLTTMLTHGLLLAMVFLWLLGGTLRGTRPSTACIRGGLPCASSI
jgi:hypothetical protein